MAYANHGIQHYKKKNAKYMQLACIGKHPYYYEFEKKSQYKLKFLVYFFQIFLGM